MYVALRLMCLHLMMRWITSLGCPTRETALRLHARLEQAAQSSMKERLPPQPPGPIWLAVS